MNESSKSLPGWRFPAEYEARSSRILDAALSEVGMYRSWRAFDPGPHKPTDVRYAAMPPLTKKDIREHFPDVVPHSRNIEQAVARGEIQLVQTSGTTDDKITNLWNQEWWDASERGSWKLNSHMAKWATGSHHEAILVNPKNVGIPSDEVDLPMEKRRLGHFLYLNEKTDPLAWSAAIMDRMVAELNSFQPAVLESNPSMLARLSRYISASGKAVHQPGVVVFTYEYPTRLHRRQIREVFDVPFASSYGTTEVGYVFMECEHGRLHQNSDFCRVDYEPLLKRQGGPLLGRILVTPLDNPWNYLVRFNTGDLVRIEPGGTCPCGRDSGIILSSIQGRTVNLTTTGDGRLVTLDEVDNTVSRIRGIEEYKLVQNGAAGAGAADAAYDLHIDTRVSDTARMKQQATEALKDLYGAESSVSVIFEKAIAPEASGKYLISRAMFPIDIEEFLDRPFKRRQN
jgi:phenylacetate-coenzyme A ligase PaaK-like adenylate-forming protein